MSDIEIPVAEPVELTPEQARELTDQIRAGVTNLLPIIKRAFEGRADRAMGYDSWNAYCDAELRGIRVPVALEDRRAAVAELREAGMSTRAIGAALGTDQSTVVRDLKATDAGCISRPEVVTSLDGRERPSSRPERLDCFRHAGEILAALDEAGRLLPPGTNLDAAQEYGVRGLPEKWGYDPQLERYDNQEEARVVAEAYKAKVVTRTVGPWVEVPDA